MVITKIAEAFVHYVKLLIVKNVMEMVVVRHAKINITKMVTVVFVHYVKQPIV